MLDDATVARIASLFRQHPDSRIVYSDAITENSYVVDRSGARPIIYLHPAHKEFASLQASWHTPTKPDSDGPASIRHISGTGEASR